MRYIVRYVGDNNPKEYESLDEIPEPERSAAAILCAAGCGDATTRIDGVGMALPSLPRGMVWFYLFKT